MLKGFIATVWAALHLASGGTSSYDLLETPSQPPSAIIEVVAEVDKEITVMTPSGLAINVKPANVGE